MQPPPRKVKPTVQLKNVHSEQLTKLQQKHQHDVDLLEDVRLYAKQRSTIEKEYGQALQKLVTQFMSKREFPSIPNITSEDGKEHKRPVGRTILQVWQSVLEQTEQLAKSRLTTAEMYLQQISKPLVPLKNNKIQISKKVFEQEATVQKEVAQTVHEMAKAHKLYSDDEHLAHEASLKFSEAEEKVKNKSTGIFTSLATLQRNSAKLHSRAESTATKATATRNEYVLTLAAANAHQIRYYSTDLPELLTTLDGDMYEKMQEFFTILGKAELESCKTALECYSTVLSDADLISRQYNLQCFLHENLVFTDLLQYRFDPVDNDPVDKVTSDHNAGLHLNKEARKWATKIAKENKAIRDNNRALQALSGVTASEKRPSESSQDSKDGTTVPDPEQKREEHRENIRKAETGKMKAEARIEALRVAGINVDEWLNSANVDSLGADDDEISRTSSSVSVRTESSGRSLPNGTKSKKESTADDLDSQGVGIPNDSTYINYEEDDFVDETFDATMLDTSSTGYSSGRNYPLKCVALYDFQANNADELSLAENETLELVADGDGDGWVRARNLSGKTGFIPENYIQILDDQSSLSLNGHTEVNVDSDMPSNGGETLSQSQERLSMYSSTDFEVQEATQPFTPGEGLWARALYDYEATSPEELTFQEGQLIKILRKDENGIDDGWWEGEVNGQVGVFPSLVVEEFTAPVNGEGLLSPDRPGPPAFSPPAPGPPPPQVEITLPTPDDSTLDCPSLDPYSLSPDAQKSWNSLHASLSSGIVSLNIDSHGQPARPASVNIAEAPRFAELGTAGGARSAPVSPAPDNYQSEVMMVSDPTGADNAVIIEDDDNEESVV